jgi:hypothetical protein
MPLRVMGPVGLPQLISKVTATGPVAILSLTGLNLVPGKVYKFVAYLISNQAIFVRYHILWNNDAVAANYVMTAIIGFATDVGNVITRQIYGDNTYNDNNTMAEPLLCVGDLVINAAGSIHMIVHSSGYGPPLVECEVATLSFGYYPGVAINAVTRIDITATVAASIAAGSFIAVYDTER